MRLTQSLLKNLACLLFISSSTQGLHFDNLMLHLCNRVIDGWEVLDSLEAQPVKEKYRPLNDPCIRDVTIHANPIADGLVSKPS